MTLSDNLTQRIRTLRLETYVIYYAVKDPRVPWFAKLVAGGAVGYQVSPIQLVPNWVPVLGLVDNFLALALAAWLVRRVTPQIVIAECSGRAQAALLRHAQAMGGVGARIAAAGVLIVWLLSGIVVGLLIARAL
jgi:uncharacterized membrane protein YkvA (DUF1232 family)